MRCTWSKLSIFAVQCITCSCLTCQPPLSGPENLVMSWVSHFQHYEVFISCRQYLDDVECGAKILGDFLVAEMHRKLQDIALPLVSILPALGIALRYIGSHPHVRDNKPWTRKQWHPLHHAPISLSLVRCADKPDVTKDSPTLPESFPCIFFEIGHGRSYSSKGISVRDNQP